MMPRAGPLSPGSGPHRGPGMPAARAVRTLFWTSGLLLASAQVGDGVLLAALRRTGLPVWEAPAPAPGGPQPRVSLIVAAHREEAVIEARVANALALDWPREALEIVVAVDGGAAPGAD